MLPGGYKGLKGALKGFTKPPHPYITTYIHLKLSSHHGLMDTAMEYHAGDPGSNPVTFKLFFIFFLMYRVSKMDVGGFLTFFIDVL